MATWFLSEVSATCRQQRDLIRCLLHEPEQTPAHGNHCADPVALQPGPPLLRADPCRPLRPPVAVTSRKGMDSVVGPGPVPARLLLPPGTRNTLSQLPETSPVCSTALWSHTCCDLHVQTPPPP